MERETVNSGQGMLVVGQRRNYRIGNQLMVSLQDVQSAKLKSKLFTPMAVDYFIFSKYATDWNSIPKLVIGK